MPLVSAFPPGFFTLIDGQPAEKPGAWAGGGEGSEEVELKY